MKGKHYRNPVKGVSVSMAKIIAFIVLLAGFTATASMNSYGEAAKGPSIPLLGATLVASLAFFPIYLAETDTGEYAGSLFVVVAASLILSWILAVTLTPIHCFDFPWSVRT